MSWSIINGDGTIEYRGMGKAAARRRAQEEANDHQETFWVAESGRTYPDRVPYLGLGEPVRPEVTPVVAGAACATEDSL